MRLLADNRIEQPLFGGIVRLRLDLLALCLTHHDQRAFHKVANDLLDIAANIADLGELGRLDLQEGRIGKPRQASRHLRLANARRSDHQDILGRDLFSQRPVHLLAAPAVAQGNRDGALGGRLADNMAVEFGDDLARGQFTHGDPVLRAWRAKRSEVQSFDCETRIGIDADIGGDLHRLEGQRFRILLVAVQRTRRRQGIIAPRPDRHDMMFRFKHVAGSGQDQRHFTVRHDQHRFELLKIFLGAPVLGQFDSRTLELAGKAFELFFQPLEQGKGVGGCPGKAGKDFPALQRADLAGIALHHGLANRHLAIADKRDAIGLANGQNGGSVPAGRDVIR